MQKRTQPIYMLPKQTAAGLINLIKKEYSLSDQFEAFNEVRIFMILFDVL